MGGDFRQQALVVCETGLRGAEAIVKLVKASLAVQLYYVYLYRNKTQRIAGFDVISLKPHHSIKLITPKHTDCRRRLFLLVRAESFSTAVIVIIVLLLSIHIPTLNVECHGKFIAIFFNGFFFS